jgi:ABC-type uncharacterized transport systems, ATPase components
MNGLPAEHDVERPPGPPAIELRHIEKRFGEVHANRDVCLSVKRGSITGIVGENGAGKSTLMSILYGFYEADGGEILIKGKPARIRSPSAAIALGIGMVHQHFMLVENFTVLENIMLGAEGGALLRSGVAAARAEVERLERDYGLGVDPDARVSELPVGAQQRVEILKALYRGAEILILDEPTGVLTPQETDQLFRVLATLRARGATIILITHKLREIMAATDEVYVMRAGSVVAFRATAETSEQELADLMVGRKIRLTLDKTPVQRGAPLLTVSHLSCMTSAACCAGRCQLHHRRWGDPGHRRGQRQWPERASGGAGRHPHPRRAASSSTAGRSRPSGPAARPRCAVWASPMCPKTAIASAWWAISQPANRPLGYQHDPAYGAGWLLDRGAVQRHCAALMEEFDVRPRAPALRSANFSGGNQQKLIIAREMARRPKLLLVGQPTRGVDIGAIEFIHRQLLEHRAAGRASSWSRSSSRR